MGCGEGKAHSRGSSERAAMSLSESSRLGDRRTHIGARHVCLLVMLQTRAGIYLHTQTDGPFYRQLIEVKNATAKLKCEELAAGRLSSHRVGCL